MPVNSSMKIESREHLLSTLAEASELEHTLMCLYLYAVFSLKQSQSEDLSEEEFAAIVRWREAIMNVAIQEMTHLALIANLTTAVGGTAHFYRPHFPVEIGHFPAEFVIELAPFDIKSIDHFIYLERPEGKRIDPSEAFEPEVDYARPSPRGRLMAHSGDYKTVGQLYDVIEEAIEYLSKELGESKLFCGSLALQITPAEIELEGLTLINDKASALLAIKTIVEQGEGARTEEGSHFETFQLIKKEYEALLQQNSKFQPGRPSARNPVMRKPADESGKVWISHPQSVLYLDLGNALYSLMLRFLLQIYSMESRPAEGKKVLLECAFSLMHSIETLGSLLSKMPATEEDPTVNAGLSFSLNRHFSPFELTSEKKLLNERIEEIQSAVQFLLNQEQSANDGTESVFEPRVAFEKVQKNLSAIQKLLAVALPKDSTQKNE